MDKPAREPSIPWGMKKACIAITIQSFLFGYLLACFNACLATGDNNSGSDCFEDKDSSCPQGTVYNDLDLTPAQAAFITGMTVLGAWLGCMASSRPAEAYGRRTVLIFNCFLFIIGAVLTGAAKQVITLMVGRFISGLGVGVAGGVPAVLLAELATDTRRGAITTLHQVMITLGIFVAGVLSYVFAVYVDHGWQYIQVFSAVPAFLMLCFCCYLPESPRWLIVQHLIHKDDLMPQSRTSLSLSFNPLRAILDAYVPSRVTNDEINKTKFYEQAERVLRAVRPVAHDVELELRIILDAVRHDSLSESASWSEVFEHQRGLLVGAGLMLCQALTGINSVTFYSATIFKQAGFHENIIASAAVGFVQLIAVVVVAKVIDRTGRRKLLLTGTSVMLLCLLVISTALLCKLPDDTHGIIAVAGLLLYVGGYGVGLGAAVWTVMVEAMPTRVRMKALTLFLSVNWAGNLVISLLTLTAIDGLGGVKHSMDDDAQEDAQKKGVALLYFIFASMTVCALLFIHFVVPETKGLNIEGDLHALLRPLVAERTRDSALIR